MRWLHISGYVVDQGFDLAKVLSEIVSRIYLVIGATAALMLAVLAVTSTDGMIRRLGGRNWRLLHQLSYFIGLLASIHYFMQSKLFVDEATVLGGLYLWLMGYRLLAWLGPVSLWRLAALRAGGIRPDRARRGGLLHAHPRHRSGAGAGGHDLSTVTGIRPAVYVLGITLAVALVAALRALPLRQRRTARA